MPLPALAALAIPAAAGLAGGVIGNRAQSKEARKDRRFQERMSSTQWQRGIKDMEAAGVNPALAYSQGGASSPSGAMASQDDVISGSVSSAQDARRLKAQIELMNEQAGAALAANKKDTNLAALGAADVQYRERQQKFQEIQNELAGLSLFSARNIAGVSDTKYGKFMTYLDRIKGMGPSVSLSATTRR